MPNKSQRNNNPVNLRHAGQKEAIGKDDTGFAVFPDAPAGFRAAHAQIVLDQKRGLTVEQFIYKFAPPNENSTEVYLKVVCRHMRCEHDELLSNLSPQALAGAMAHVEGYYNKEG